MSAAPRPALRAWRFLALAVGWSWGWWWIAVALGRPIGDPAVLALLAIGILGLPGGALFCLYRHDGAAPVRDYWQRLTDPRRAGFRGLLLALTAIPATALIAAALYAQQAGHWPDFAPLRHYLAAPAMLALYLGWMIVFGPLPEEMGWRGYALEPLQQAYGPLAAALILGAIHAAWHLPLFYVAGSFQHALGAFTPEFWRFMADTVSLSVFMTALLNSARGSTLAAVLMHWSANLSGELLHLPNAARWDWTAVMAAAALGLILTSKGRLLRRDTRQNA